MSSQVQSPSRRSQERHQAPPPSWGREFLWGIAALSVAVAIGACFFALVWRGQAVAANNAHAEEERLRVKAQQVAAAEQRANLALQINLSTTRDELRAAADELSRAQKQHASELQAAQARTRVAEDRAATSATQTATAATEQERLLTLARQETQTAKTALDKANAEIVRLKGLLAKRDEPAPPKPAPKPVNPLIPAALVGKWEGPSDIALTVEADGSAFVASAFAIPGQRGLANFEISRGEVSFTGGKPTIEMQRVPWTIDLAADGRSLTLTTTSRDVSPGTVRLTKK